MDNSFSFSHSLSFYLVYRKGKKLPNLPLEQDPQIHTPGVVDDNLFLCTCSLQFANFSPSVLRILKGRSVLQTWSRMEKTEMVACEFVAEGPQTGRFCSTIPGSLEISNTGNCRKDSCSRTQNHHMKSENRRRSQNWHIF